MSISPIVGLAEVGRSEAIVQPPVNQNQDINQLIQQLKTRDWKTRFDAVYSLGQMGESAKSAVPSLIALLKDQSDDVRSAAANALKKLGYKP